MRLCARPHVADIAVHTATCGAWLRKRGNRAGALFAWGLAALCLGLTVYRLAACR